MNNQKTRVSRISALRRALMTTLHESGRDTEALTPLAPEGHNFNEAAYGEWFRAVFSKVQS